MTTLTQAHVDALMDIAGWEHEHALIPVVEQIVAECVAADRAAQAEAHRALGRHDMSDLPAVYFALDGEDEPTLWIKATGSDDKALIRRCEVGPLAWSVVVVAVEEAKKAAGNASPFAQEPCIPQVNSDPIPALNGPQIGAQRTAPVDSGAIGRLAALDGTDAGDEQ